jgi:NADPH-dependent curcumin reductase CurA
MEIPKIQRVILFQKRPEGLPTEECFLLSEAPVPEIGEGEVLVKTHFLSIDPYMRNAMGGDAHYGPLNPGDVMIGRGAGVVVESRHKDFAVGDAVQSEFGWREYVALQGDGLRKLPPDLKPLSLSLGVVGQSAATAWVGLRDVAKVQRSETIVVSAAAGAVGSAVGQIGRILGCRVVGIAGGPEKCRHVVEDLGFDACVDYKAGRLSAALAEAVPEGIDVYFDNVGGETLDAVLENVNEHARLAICGQISQYNLAKPRPLENIGVMLGKSVMMQGFRIGARLDRRDQALGELIDWWRAGKLNYRETVSEGFETAPVAFINMLTGGNRGKQVVRVAD